MSTPLTSQSAVAVAAEAAAAKLAVQKGAEVAAEEDTALHEPESSQQLIRHTLRLLAQAEQQVLHTRRDTVTTPNMPKTAQAADRHPLWVFLPVAEAEALMLQAVVATGKAEMAFPLKAYTIRPTQLEAETKEVPDQLKCIRRLLSPLCMEAAVAEGRVSHKADMRQARRQVVRIMAATAQQRPVIMLRLPKHRRATDKTDSEVEAAVDFQRRLLAPVQKVAPVRSRSVCISRAQRKGGPT